MFGKLIGAVLAAPVRVASAAAKVVEDTLDAATATSPQPKNRNTLLDRIADDIQETTERLDR